MEKKIKGLIAAPFTAFNHKGEINLEMIPRQVELLLQQDIIGAYILGTTGEGVSCSLEERMTVMEAWAQASHGRLLLIAHVGALALPEIKRLSRHAVACGFDATSVIPPTFFRPANARILARYLSEIASYSPELPFYYYHTMNANLNISVTDLLETVESEYPIPNLQGVKFNHHDLFDYQNALQVADGKYDIVYGVDEFFAGALSVGACGFIGSTYNYAAKTYHKIWSDWKAGKKEAVQDGMRIVCKGVRILTSCECGLACGKTLMQLHGLNCGDVRLPLIAMSDTKQKEILAEATKIYNINDK